MNAICIMDNERKVDTWYCIGNRSMLILGNNATRARWDVINESLLRGSDTLAIKYWSAGRPVVQQPTHCHPK